MKSLLLAGLAVFACIYQVHGGVNPDRKASVSNTQLLQQLSTASSQFSLDLYNKFTAQHSNLIISPFSVFTALAMTSLGARGATHDEIFQTLNIQSLGEDIHQAFHYYTSLLQGLTNVTMTNANGIFVRPGTTLLPEFTSKMKSYYDASAEQFDFSNPGGPEAPINAWVSNRTDGMIKDFLPPGSVDASTVMWLLNAIYFKGTWSSVFDERRTHKQPFHVDATTTVDVDMMSIEEAMFNYKRLDNLKTTILELPYVGNRYSMFILLPDAVDGLAALESGLDATTLDAALRNMYRMSQFNLQLPKFSLKTKVNMNSQLQQLGLRQIFDSRSDLSGITGHSGLYVDTVLQEAKIEVSESGTRAAAVTGIAIVEMAMMTRHVSVNHPFMFLIRDKSSNINVFMGRYSGPQ